MRKSRTDDIRAVMMETAKVQVATLNAGIEFWSGWVESATKFTQSAASELTALSTGDADADHTLSRIADSSRKYLDAITELPGKAAARFSQDLKTSRRAGAKPRRAAKAKP